MRKRGHQDEFIAVERIDIEHMGEPQDRPFRRSPIDEDQMIAGGNHAFLDDAIVPAGAAALLGAPSHLRYVETDIELPARLTTLGYFELCAAELEDIADRDDTLIHASGREVLPECTSPVKHNARPDLCTPESVMLERIMMNGLVRSAMMAPIALRVALKALTRKAQRVIHHFLGNTAWPAALPERPDDANE